MYQFRREDNGEVVEVDYTTMMSHVAGFITLPDGALAKRVADPDMTTFQRKGDTHGIHQPTISDGLGFIASQLPEFEAHRKMHGLSGISFQPDPHVPGFVQVRAESQRDYDRYAKARGMVNRTGSRGHGAQVDATSLERAKAMLLERYGQGQQKIISAKD